MWNLELILTLIALLLAVLILRQPVARYFGSKAAYLLWLAPGLRLLTPTLPALPAIKNNPVDPNSEVLPAQMTPLSLEENYAELAQINIADPVLQMSASAMWMGLWFAGFLICISVMTARQFRFQKALCQASNPSLDQKVQRQAAKLGLNSPAILTGAESPMTTGLFRPVLVLPEDFETRFNSDEQVYILDHELLHIRRKDLWAKACALLFCAANWFNPLAWFALSRFEADQEAACDADLLARHSQSAKPYAELLFKVSNPQGYRTLLTLEAGGFLHRRLAQISRNAISHTQQKIGIFLSIMTTLGLVLGTAQYAQAKTERSEKPELEFGFVRGAEDLKIVNFISSDGPMSPAEEQLWLKKLDEHCPVFTTAFQNQNSALKPEPFTRTIFATKVNHQMDRIEDSKGYSSISCISGPSATKTEAYLAAIARQKESLPQDIRNAIPLADAAYQYLENLEQFPEYLAIPIIQKPGDPPMAIPQSAAAMSGKSMRTRMIVLDAPEIPEGAVFIPAETGPKNLNLEHLKNPNAEPVTVKDCGEQSEITWWVVKKSDGRFDLRQELCVESSIYQDKAKLRKFMLEDVLPMTHNPSMTPAYRTAIIEALKQKAKAL